MSEEESPDLTKSWVFLDSEKKPSEDPISETSGVDTQDTESHVDSDTDSISVISESGCSYKTDEEEFVPASEPVTNVESEESSVNTSDTISEITPETTAEIIPEITEVKHQEPLEPPKPHEENEKFEKLLYFATSAACALILVGFSILVQHYFYDASDVNKFTADFEQLTDLPVSHYEQSVKSQNVQADNHLKKSYNFKRKSQPKIKEARSKAVKLQIVDDFHDKIALPSAQIENNDLTVEDDVNSNYKVSKNKSPAAKFNKENCDDTGKRTKNDNFKIKNFDEINKKTERFKRQDKIIGEQEYPQNDETYNEKLAELKIKEDYLREKEKFLIEKEHDLMKKEIKLHKEKQNYGKSKYEKKNQYQYKKDKEYKYRAEEYNNKEKKDKFQAQKKYFDGNDNEKDKKYKDKAERKRHHDQNKRRVIDDMHNKKRNISGQWYIDLHKARNNMRQKEHASDWVFDRAYLRSLKRNKARWYFQWMVDRARLRVK